ncbi:hypothetical protein A3A60_04090 [Candidatus Curtissbacteria bacterium RIFCSPLOWO2_01_FULL_42_26]|uniref:Pyruvate carboxyltransferase domain-containing protein n=1 Tax=Candidatus Curtissbacteria bacterium RIFCSPLOWO2_01_FULL_42_26 TaxID=1797729 RepID=A0A1F5HYN8_9BACT|nr:MAG: hypothetical protein A3A60_04090 [Candidatus Curtissbacteria bacterium RIFCSPLOWO2_01_FULL_42_26]
MTKEAIVYNWSGHKNGPTEPVRFPVRTLKIDDETLRDGLQGSQLEKPITINEKQIYIELASPFVDHFDVAYPNSHESQARQALCLIKHAIESNLQKTFSLAGRAAVWDDIKPMVDIFEQLGSYPQLRADIFLDGSIHRSEFEGWDRKSMMDQMVQNIRTLKQQGLQVMFVAERATATPPNELEEVFVRAADSGADTLCIADTQGSMDPIGMTKILRWALDNVGKRYPDIEWDAHCHNHLGMAVANSLIAAHEGFNEVHGASLWLGEGPGNADNSNLLLALVARGYLNRDLTGLKRFYEDVSKLLGIEIPVSAPGVGKSAFRTSSGIHARALEKGEQAERAALIYWPIQPETVGALAGAEIGPMSSPSNVRLKLKELGEPYSEKLTSALLNLAKEKGVKLTNETIMDVIIGIRTQPHRDAK